MNFVVVLGLLLAAATVAESNAILPQIVGGTLAPSRLFPYMAMLRAERENREGVKWGTFCGASLISEDFVLTAAHCVNGEVINIKLVFGSVNSEQNEDEPHRVVINVPKENIIMYEKYDEDKRKDDIALVKLNQKIEFSSWIQPVRLPARSQNNLDWDVGVITGWGSMGMAAGDSKALHYAQLRILPDEKCKKVFGSSYHESNLCLDGTRQSPCYGDAGGPAVIVDRRDRLFTLVGVASYVSKEGCENDDPVGYARVTSFLDWIHDHTGIPIQD